MKKLIFFFFILFLMFFSLNSQNVSSLGIVGTYYDIRSDNTGTIHIIWTDNGWQKYGQIVNRQVVNQVTIPVLDRNEVSYRKFRPRLSVKPDGSEVHFVWATPLYQSKDLMHAWKDSVGTWRKEKIFTSSKFIVYPTFTVDSSGVYHAACIEDTGTSLLINIAYYRKPSGGEWTRMGDIAPRTAEHKWPNLFTDTGGNVHITWDKNKDYIQYRSTSSGGDLSASSTTTLPILHTGNKQAEVFADAVGNVHVAALSYNSPGSAGGIDYWVKPVGGGFSTPIQVTGGDFSLMVYFPHPAVIARSTDLVAVSWVEEPRSPATVKVAIYNGGWTVYTLSKTANVTLDTRTTMAMDDESAYLIWREYDGSLWLATFDYAVFGVLSPNGGEEWDFGKSYDIRWNLEDATGNVDINLFKNNVDLGPIVSDISNSGTYSWTIDTLESGAEIVTADDYQIQVIARDNSDSDMSNSTFTLLPSIAITSPTNSSIWFTNSTYTVTWDVYGTMNDSVKLRIYQNEIKILGITDITENDGSYTFTIPDTISPASNYVVRVKTIDNLHFDNSEEFEISAGIVPPSIELTSPNSSSNWISGSTNTITWNKVGTQDANVKIELMKGGSLESTISASTSNDGSFSWTISGSQATGSDYLIRITTLDDQVTDDSSLFTITYTASAITITSPTTGVSWNRANTYSINWDSAGSMDSNVKIELIKGGSLNSTISASTANDGSFSWAIPSVQATGSDYLVRITTLDGQVTDDSGVFSITELLPEGITVTSPSAGQQWIHGNTYSITWNSVGQLDANVKIRIYQGDTKIYALSDSTPNDGSFSWTVPITFPSASDYVIRVKTLDQLYYDNSDQFYIGAGAVTPTITVTSPSTSTDWEAGSTQTISWNKSGIQDANVKIELFKGESLDSTISSSATNNGSFSWIINSGQTVGSDYTVKVTTLDGQVTDDSDVFTISQPVVPTVTITSPVSSSDWAAGSVQSISWDKTGTQDTDVKIELFKGGSLNSTISASTSNNGSFSWTVSGGQAAGSDYTVKITTLDGQVTDDSDTFTISVQQQDGITITSPTSSSVWTYDNTYTVTWNAVGTMNARVKLRVYQGDTKIFALSDDTENDGSFSWTVPSSIPEASDYVIRVKTLDNLVFDNSDLFYIGPQAADPTITVTAPISSSTWVTEQTYAVTWNKTGTQDSNVKIDLYKGGSLDSTIIASTPNSGSYSWTIDGDQTIGTDYVVRVTTIDDIVTDDSDQFEISDTATEIAITSPDQTSELNAGSNTVITWNTSGSMSANVNIYLYDNGSFHSNIVLSTVNDGNYTWSVGSGLSSSNRYMVRVETVDSQISDDSDLFKVFGIGLTIDLPESGDTLARGSSVDISWKPVGSLNANVKLRLYQGITKIVGITDMTANDGSYTWVVPGDVPDAANYFVRVKTVDNLVYDDTDLVSVAGAGITVTSPSSNNVLKKGSEYTITWTSSGSQNSNVKLIVFQGTTQVQVITNSTTNDGSYTWTVPGTIANANDLVIKVETIDNLVSDESGLITIED